MNPREIFNQAHRKNEECDFVEAIKLYSSYIELVPEDSNGYTNRGEVKVKMGNLKDAINDFKMAVKMNPNNPYALMNLAASIRELGEFSEAINYYTKIIKINPSFISMVYSNRATAKGAIGDLKGALEDLDISIQINSEDSYAYQSRATVKEYLGDINGAKEDFEKAKNFLNLL